MFKHLRSIGVLACLVSTALFFVGALTDHWVESDNGHYGLWEVCDNTHTNRTVNSTQYPTTPASLHTLLMTTNEYNNRKLNAFDAEDWLKQDRDDDKTEVEKGSKDKEDESDDNDVDKSKEKDSEEKKEDDGDDDDDDDESCSPFSILSLPAFLHIVRLIMIGCGGVLGWGLVSGRSFRFNIPNGNSFFDQHRFEAIGICACLVTLVGFYLFTDNYKGLKADIFSDSSLGSSFYICRSGVYLFFPAAILMMSPSLQEKFDDNCECSLCAPFQSICIRLESLNKRITRRRSANQQQSNLEISAISSNRRHSFPSAHYDNETDADVEPHNISFQISETDSQITTNTGDGNDENGNSGNIINPGLDLPRYEDVATTSPLPTVDGRQDTILPPPPSYDEVLAGVHLSFAPPAQTTSTYPNTQLNDTNSMRSSTRSSSSSSSSSFISVSEDRSISNPPSYQSPSSTIPRYPPPQYDESMV